MDGGNVLKDLERQSCCFDGIAHPYAVGTESGQGTVGTVGIVGTAETVKIAYSGEELADPGGQGLPEKACSMGRPTSGLAPAAPPKIGRK